MTAAVALFLFGLVAGFVLINLRRRAPNQLTGGKVVEVIGWAIMGAALTLAVALITWAALIGR